MVIRKKICAYSDVQCREKGHRHAVLKSVGEALRMSPVEVLTASLVWRYVTKAMLQSKLESKNSVLRHDA